MRRRGNSVVAVLVLLVTAVAWFLRRNDLERAPLPPAGAPTSLDASRLDTSRLRVRDGDTVAYGDVLIRLLGTDAPERRSPHFPGDQEPYGTRAKEYLEGLLARAKEVRMVRIRDPDPYDRVLAYLYADDVNVNAAMVRAGHAYETVSHFGNQGLPKEAQEVLDAARGVTPAFERPSDWRRRAKAGGGKR